MGAGDIRLRRTDWEVLASHLTACWPEEGCGLLAGTGEQVRKVLPVENELHSRTRYRMEPRALVAALHRIEAEGMEMLAAFHSHPAGPDGVSATDQDEWAYPGAALVVCTRAAAGWSGRAYRIEHGDLREVLFVLEDQ